MKFSINTWIIFSIGLLTASAGWIWYSRVPSGINSAGEDPQPRVGFAAPDFSLQTSDGRLFTISSLRGKPILLNIWASWCAPCRAEMPAMERVYRDYSQRGLIILAVNATNQDDPKDAIVFAEENDLTFPILLDLDGRASEAYQIRALPSSFFIDTNGQIREVVIGGPMSEALIRVRVEQLLEEIPP